MNHILELDSLLYDSSSDDELEIISTLAIVKGRLDGEGGSRSRHDSARRRNTIWRDSLQGEENLFRDYFAESPVFPPKKFRRRFRMRRDLFMRIHDAIISHDRYFVQRRNAAKKLGHSSLQKMTTAIRMLAYGVTADFMDEYLLNGERTAMDSFIRFVKAVVSVFSAEYLRSPNPEDIARLLAIGESRGFPRMLGSIDCMHWKWKNCPNAWRGMYSGHIREPTIILEAVASNDLWIWHAFFGLPGSHNDINVLERSNVFANLAEGRAPPVNYSVNGHDYTMGYYLSDGIYPSWATFVKTIHAPQGNKRKNFAAAQESARKDVERAFGVLQARFAIVRGRTRLYEPELLKDIMMACIILHNMIVEDGRDLYIGADEFNYEQINDIPLEPPSHECTDEIVEFMQNRHRIRDQETHSQLQLDLIEHLWQIHSQS
ncbi:uncharacterized protein LOC133878942 [Alnus glutinosa]|uniref:uncharacterized protein LOC133878942 n=1 Tax=Alnus glutinosa TaxID=3517 RepID=UPI002D78D30A|nr:uncharacterized protein LOC133878942 [Alnus glutinosa]